MMDKSAGQIIGELQEISSYWRIRAERAESELAKVREVAKKLVDAGQGMLEHDGYPNRSNMHVAIVEYNQLLPSAPKEEE
jgi:hypothetical protein